MTGSPVSPPERTQADMTDELSYPPCGRDIAPINPRQGVLSDSADEHLRLLAHHPGVQQGIADIVMELEAIGPQLDSATRDWSEGVNHGGYWPIKIVSAKYRAVEGAWRVVDRALDLSGGFGMFKKSEMERLFRDARAGRFHPANSLLSHELVGKLTLGINPDEQPRWG